MSSQTYDGVNKAWKSTCKILFGCEVGELEGFSQWLSEFSEMPRMEKSAVSGKEVTLTEKDYAAGSKFISFDEVDFGKKFAPLTINEVKDIDSIVQAISDREFYTGNVVLGNSSFVEKSSKVLDSHFVYDSTVITSCKYVGYSKYVEDSEYCFGMLGLRNASFAIRTLGGQVKRSFECSSVEAISDGYYCASVKSCNECMFCFGAVNGAYMVGNLKLPKDKYMAIKANVLSQIAQKLKKDRRIFSIFDLISGAKKYQKTKPSIKANNPKEAKFDIAPIEEAFSSASQILLGKRLFGIDGYGGFLQKHCPQNTHFESPFSGNRVIVAGYRAHLPELYDLAGRLVTEEEVREIGKIALEEYELAKIEIEPTALAKKFGGIAYSELNKVYGKIVNVEDGAVVVDSENCYKGSAFITSKKCAYSFWPDRSESIFGSHTAIQSAFCMNCYYSKKLNRCFEVDSSSSCNDLYFSHNCENILDGMFCFNAKAKRCAIGNAEMEKSAYAKVKSNLLAQIASELEGKKDLKWDIFTLGAGKK